MTSRSLVRSLHVVSLFAEATITGIGLVALGYVARPSGLVGLVGFGILVTRLITWSRPGSRVSDTETLG